MSDTNLPAFVAELEEEEKVFGEKEFVSAEVIKGFRSRMGEYVPALIALVRQLQGENAELTDKIVKAKALIDCKDQIVTLRRKMTNGAADPLTQRIVLSLCDLIVEIERSLEDG